MWFAALGSPEQSPWLEPLCGRLLQGSPDVLALLAVTALGEAHVNSGQLIGRGLGSQSVSGCAAEVYPRGIL